MAPGSTISLLVSPNGTPANLTWAPFLDAAAAAAGVMLSPRFLRFQSSAGQSVSVTFPNTPSTTRSFTIAGTTTATSDFDRASFQYLNKTWSVYIAPYDLVGVSPSSGYAFQSYEVVLTTSGDFGVLGTDVASVQYRTSNSSVTGTCTGVRSISSTQIACTTGTNIGSGVAVLFEVLNSGGLVRYLSTATATFVGIASDTAVAEQVFAELSDPSVPYVNPLPAATATTVVTAAGSVIDLVQTPNPCETDDNPCLNGATCTFTAATGSNSTGDFVAASLTCECVTSFYGPTCSLAVLDCVDCVSLYNGGQSMTLFGVGLSAVIGVRIAGHIVPFEHGNVSVMTSDDAKAALALPWPHSVKELQTLEYVRFLSPSIISSTNATNASTLASTDSSSRRLMTTTETVNPHVTSDLAIQFPNGFLFAYSLVGQLYYSKDSCLKAGQWKEDGLGGCEPCPTGGQWSETAALMDLRVCSRSCRSLWYSFVPVLLLISSFPQFSPGGGGRVWPVEDYWSYNELTAPIVCPLATAGACPGVIVSSAYTAQATTTGEKNTQICADGYRSDYCTLCADGYYMNAKRCLSCGSEASARAYFSLMIIAGFALMAGMSIAVAILSAAQLANFVTIVVLFQQVVSVGKASTQSLPSNALWLAEFFNAVSIVNLGQNLLNSDFHCAPFMKVL